LQKENNDLKKELTNAVDNISEVKKNWKQEVREISLSSSRKQEYQIGLLDNLKSHS